MGNPLSEDLSSPHLSRNNPKKRDKEKAADLEYEWQRQDWIAWHYRDSREPPPPRIRRGRKA
jgi:hypothetical protein